MSQSSSEPTLEEILTAIEQYCGDEFCEELEMRDFNGKLSGDLKEARKRLGEIYKIAHGFNASHSCYHVHGPWRRLEETRCLTVKPAGPRLIG